MQHFALQIMIGIEKYDRAEREDEALRRTLLAMRPDLVRGLYPSLFEALEPGEDDDSEETEGELDFGGHMSNYDMSGVEWQSPADVDAEEVELLQQMLQDNTVTVTADSRPPEGVEEDFGLIGQPDDAEWT